MTRDEVIRLLRAVSEACRELDQIQGRIALLDSLRKRMTPAYSLAPGGGGDSSNIESITAQIMELEASLQENQQKYIAVYMQASEMVSRLEEQNHKAAAVLRLRYIERFSWKNISKRLHYSKGWVFKLHNQGLDILGGCCSG